MADDDKKMIGFVIVTHGNLGQSFLDVLEHIVGKQKAVEVIAIQPDDDMEKQRKNILDAVEKVRDEPGVIIFTDMFGGTPSNLSVAMMEQDKTEVIAGVNLPMLIKFASLREKKLSTVATVVQETGRKYINIASGLLKSEAKK